MKRLMTLMVVLCGVTGFAQDHFGYYGKKAYVSASSNFYIPLVYSTFGPSGYEVNDSGDGLVYTKDRFNLGGNLSIGYSITSSFGVAFEVGYDRFNIHGDFFNYDENAPFVFSNEKLVVNSLSLMPKLEFAGRNGLLPNGLFHELGIGGTINTAARKNYFRWYDSHYEGGPNADQSVADQLIEDNNLDVPVKLMRIMYGLRMRVPLSESLMFNYGIRYTLDFGVTSQDFGALLGKTEINYEFYKEVRRYQFYSVISLDLGLTLPF